MRVEQKENVKNSVGRMLFVALSLFIQVGWILIQFLKLNTYSTVIALLSSLLALLVAIRIYCGNTNSAFKLAWIIPILAFPVLGLCIYFLFGHSQVTAKMKKKSVEINDTLGPLKPSDEAILQSLEKKDFGIANQCRYLSTQAGYPVFQNSDLVFYKQASEGFEAQLEAIKQAKHFIFLEYHAIEAAESFSRLHALLVKKVNEGVEVRIFYDDVGSIGFLNPRFIKEMEAEGIKCRVFNQIIPVLNVFMNNRDHRKITVIDNEIAFTGGYNLADEYFNITHPYGHWKDTGVRITGDAVTSLTLMFLEMWNEMKWTDTDYQKYLTPYHYTAKEQGFIQPYADGPLYNEPIAENVYLNLIKHAKHKLYITTPYLIISDEMNRELTLAAKRGVDVRIITPGIPDKKIIYKVTRSYYANLVQGGVRIYEYTPGFIHAKQFLCDDSVATVGTINLDYRSLYHHFENGVLLYGFDAIKDIVSDFEETFALSTEVTAQYSDKRSAVLKTGQCILRLFSPLL